MKLAITRMVALSAIGMGWCAPVASAADIAALGDSMMKAVGRAIKKEYSGGGASVEVVTSIGSGLARLDVFDWHARAASLIAEASPSMIFVMMGANDNQSMRTGSSVLSFGSPGWDVEYGRRVGQLMDILLEGGKSRVIWIGMPRMREDKLDADVRAMEKIVMQQAHARERVTYFSTLELLSPPGAYKAYIKQANGMPLDVRSEDGIHLNRNGAEYLSGLLLKNFPFGSGL